MLRAFQAPMKFKSFQDVVSMYEPLHTRALQLDKQSIPERHLRRMNQSALMGDITNITLAKGDTRMH